MSSLDVELLRRDRHIIHEKVGGLILVIDVGSLEEQYYLLAFEREQRARYIEGFHYPVIGYAGITTLLHVGYQRAGSRLQATIEVIKALSCILVRI